MLAAHYTRTVDGNFRADNQLYGNELECSADTVKSKKKSIHFFKRPKATDKVDRIMEIQ